MSAYLDLPKRSESEAMMDRIRDREARLARRGCCGVCVHLDPPDRMTRDGKIGNAFGLCPYLGKRDPDEPPCDEHFERKAIPADEEHGDVGASR